MKGREIARVRVRGGLIANRKTASETERDRMRKKQSRCMRAFPNNIEQVYGTLVKTK